MKKAIQRSSMLILIFLSAAHLLRAQTEKIIVSGKISSSKNIDGSYSYLVTGISADKAKFHKGQIKNNKFQIALDQKHQDTVTGALLFISHLANMNSKVYEQNVSKYKLYQFILDTTRIEVDIDITAKRACITGGEFNRQLIKYRQIDSLYNKMVHEEKIPEQYSYSGYYLTDANRYRILAYIDLIKQYNGSLLSVEHIASLANLPVPRMTYTYRDEIKEVFESLSPELQATQRVKDIHASFEANLKRNKPKSGLIFPILALVDQSLKPFPFQDLYADKQYVLLDFWATWCGPCIQQHPTIKQLSDQLKDSNIQVVGISIDQKPEAWSKYLVKHPFNYPQYRFDPSDKKMLDKIGVGKIPTYTLVEKSSGKVVEYDIPVYELKNLLEKYSK